MMEKVNLIEDLSTLSTVAVTNLQKLTSLSEDVISHAIMEAMLNKDPISEVDIGIGSLYILISAEEIKYKFIPSSKLQNIVKRTVHTKKSHLTQHVDEVLGRRIMDTYKDIL